MTSLDAPLSAAAVNALLAAPPLAALCKTGAPLVVAAGDPPQALFASPSAVALYGAGSLAAITDRLFSPAHGGAHLAAMAQALVAGGPPRLERRRFIVGRRSEAVTLACRKLVGPDGVPVLVIMAQGARSGPDGLAPTAALVVGPADGSVSGDAPPVEAGGFDGTMIAAGQSAPPRTFEAIRDMLGERFGGRPNIRFLWQTNASHVVTAMTSELADVVGLEAVGIVGRVLPEILTSIRPDAGLALMDSMSRRETLSRIEIAWPITAAPAAVPVEISGFPVLDAGRAFCGYRGFGLIRLDRLAEADPTPVSPAPAEFADVPDEPSAAAPVSGVDAAPAGGVRPGHREAVLQAVGAAPAAPGGPGPSLAAGGQAAQRGAATGQNVVPLRPMDGFPRGGPDRLSPTRPPDAAARSAVALSPGERQAFREIARALGVRVHEEPAPHASGTRDAESVAAGDEAGATARGAASVSERQIARSAEGGMARNAAALLQRLPIGVMVIRGTVPLYLNRTLLDLLGYDDLDSFHRTGGLARMFRDRDPASLAGSDGAAVPVVTVDGEVLTVNCLLQAAEWNGEPATLLSFRRSVEEEIASRLHSAELELQARASETRELHAMLDTATDGIAVLDGAGQIVALNRSGEALFGYDQKEVAGESITALLAPESHRTALDYLQSLKAEGVASVLNDGREVLGLERQGGVIPLFMTVGRLPDSTAQKFCAVLRDLTPWKKAGHELEEARRQAERASQLKSDFLARISHEIRTPLNAILGFAEVIMGERFGPVGNERYKDYLRDIHTSGSHVMSLVNDLLDLSKIEAGKMELTFGSVDANKIVADCVALMQPEANRERVIIRMALAGRLPNVVADDRSLRQIVLNLLSNAVKFNEPGGQVIVSSVLTDAGDAVLRIRDTGVGMSESDVETALEPFRQLPTARQKPGTGLGLPLTKALVEANRASFTIKSKKNEGTLVEIAFPAARVIAD